MILWNEVRFDRNIFFICSFFLYSRIPFSIWDFGFFPRSFYQNDRRISLVCSWIPYFLIQWRCFIFPKGPQSVLCEEHCGASHSLRSSIIRLTWTHFLFHMRIIYFTSSILSKHSSILLRTPLVTCESDRNREQNVNLCFFTLDPFPCVSHHFSHIYHAVKTMWNFLCRAWNCAGLCFL